MTVAELVLLLGGLSSLAAIGVTAWRVRRDGPEAGAQLVTASSLLLAQLQRRISALEERLDYAIAENDAYERLYGPLPPEHKKNIE